MLVRGSALPASPNAVARVLREAGYELVEQATRPHPDKMRSFERAKPNQMWQTDLFTFVLTRQNRRVYLVAFLDDHSRFIAGYGLHGSSNLQPMVKTRQLQLSLETAQDTPSLHILKDGPSQRSANYLARR